MTLVITMRDSWSAARKSGLASGRTAPRIKGTMRCALQAGSATGPRCRIASPVDSRLNRPLVKVPFLDLRAQYQFLKPEMLPAVERVMERASFILSEDVRTFEQRFAEFTSSAHVINCANGSDALEMALQALGIGPGDEVLVPAHTWLTTATAATHLGAHPVFVDSDPETYTLDLADAARKITPRTRAIMPVHIFGQAAPMDDVLALAHAHGLKVVEDCAQATGTAYKGRPVGTWGDIGCFSFYPGKNLGAYGDAGALTTQDEKLATYLRRLGNHGALSKYDNDIPGRNSRIDGLQAAVLNVKMNHLPTWIRQRRAHAARYDSLLTKLGLTPPAVAPGSVHSYHVYAMRVPQRDQVRERLAAAGVETLVHYPKAVPFLGAYAYQKRLSRPAPFEGASGHEKHLPEDFPLAYAHSNEMLSLPMFPELTIEQQDYVVAQLAQAIREA
jgi:dTDP-4-amino-4,6-dideoxygalactose transaminase